MSRNRLTVFVFVLFVAVLGCQACGGEEEGAAPAGDQGATKAPADGEAPATDAASGEEVAQAKGATDAKSSGEKADAKGDAKPPADGATATGSGKAGKKTPAGGQDATSKGAKDATVPTIAALPCDEVNGCTVEGELTPEVIAQISSRGKGRVILKGDRDAKGFKPLEKLAKKLTTVTIRANKKLKDLSFLAAFSGLKDLTLERLPHVKNIEAVGKLPGLNSLSIKRLPCMDLAPLEGLKKLKQLRLEFPRRVCMIELESVETLTSLAKLTLYVPGMGEIRVVKPLKALRELHLRGRVKKVDGLSGADKLEVLTLYGTAIRDLKPIRNLPSLHTLRLIASQVWDLRPIAQMPSLRTLLWHEPNMRALEKLVQLPGIRSLSLPRAKPTDWSVLSRMTWLTDLNLDESTFRNVALLTPLRRLKSFSCARCRLKNTKLLATLPRLAQLDLSWARGIRSLKPLAEMTSLRLLVLRPRQFSRYQRQALRKALPKLEIVRSRGDSTRRLW